MVEEDLVITNPALVEQDIKERMDPYVLPLVVVPYPLGAREYIANAIDSQSGALLVMATEGVAESDDEIYDNFYINAELDIIRPNLRQYEGHQGVYDIITAAIGQLHRKKVFIGDDIFRTRVRRWFVSERVEDLWIYTMQIQYAPKLLPVG